MSFNNNFAGGAGGNFLPSISMSMTSSGPNTSANNSANFAIRDVMPAGQTSERCRVGKNAITVQHQKDSLAKKLAGRSAMGNRNSSLPNVIAGTSQSGVEGRFQKSSSDLRSE